MLKKDEKKYKELEERSGNLMHNASEEVCFSFVFGLHHFISGLLLASHNETLTYIGIISEISFEVNDMYLILTSTYPYEKPNFTLKSAAFFHHLLGILGGV